MHKHISIVIKAKGSGHGNQKRYTATFERIEKGLRQAPSMAVGTTLRYCGGLDLLCNLLFLFFITILSSIYSLDV